MVCEFCGKEHDGSYGSGRFCCKSCSRRYSSLVNKEKKNKNISLGVNRYFSTNKEYLEKKEKKRIKELNKLKDKEILMRIKVCPVCKGEFCAPIRSRATCSDECLKELRRLKSGFRCMSHDKVSSIIKNAYKRGTKKQAGGTTKWYSYKNIKVQGTYELRTCRILDEWVKLGLISKWEYTNDRIPYKWKDDTDHTYLLDFKIHNTDESFYYIEVKGYIREHDEEKWEAVRSLGFDLVVWNLKNIEDEEIKLKLSI